MQPLKINGRTYDFTSTRCSGLPLGFDDILFSQHLRALSYSQKVTPSQPEGVHGIPLPRGRGTYKANASIELVWDVWDTFTKALADNGIDGYTDFDFNLLIQYKSQGRVCKVELFEASFLSDDQKHKQGDAGGLITMQDLYVRYIEVNGVCLYPRDLDQDLTTQSSGGVVIGV